jgi:hypothetical protein
VEILRTVVKNSSHGVQTTIESIRRGRGLLKGRSSELDAEWSAHKSDERLLENRKDRAKGRK